MSSRCVAEQRAQPVPVRQLKNSTYCLSVACLRPIATAGQGHARRRAGRRWRALGTARLYRTDGDAQRRRRLLERMSEHVLEDQRAALDRRQLHEDGERRLDERRVDAGVLWFCAVGTSGTRSTFFLFIPPQEVHRGIVRDAEQPRLEIRWLAHLTERIVRLRERFLEHVLAIEHQPVMRAQYRWSSGRRPSTSSMKRSRASTMSGSSERASFRAMVDAEVTEAPSSTGAPRRGQCYADARREQRDDRCTQAA